VLPNFCFRFVVRQRSLEAFVTHCVGLMPSEQTGTVIMPPPSVLLSPVLSGSVRRSKLGFAPHQGTRVNVVQSWIAVMKRSIPLQPCYPFLAFFLFHHYLVFAGSVRVLFHFVHRLDSCQLISLWNTLYSDCWSNNNNKKIILLLVSFLPFYSFFLILCLFLVVGEGRRTKM